MASNTATVLAAGSALRILLSQTTLPALLADRVELTTPLSSYTRLQEGYHLLTSLSRPLDPYSSGSFHGPPLLLALAGPFTHGELSGWPSCALWTAADAAIAWAISQVAKRRGRGELLRKEGEEKWSPATVAAIYLFHPFSIATTLARSGVTFSNLFLALALESALVGSYIPAVLLLSFATHFSLYPVLLLPPLILLAHRCSSPESAEGRNSLRTRAVLDIAAFLAHQAAVLFISRWMTGSWEFLSSAYGVM
ncbi:hypothetical protein JCM11641_001487 [Rhodosporidiobolus odoratus]